MELVQAAKQAKLPLLEKHQELNFYIKIVNLNQNFSSGFVGYFPENNPKYTLIAIVNNPQVDKSYYGFDAAGMVVKEIAENIK